MLELLDIALHSVKNTISISRASSTLTKFVFYKASYNSTHYYTPVTGER